MSSSKQKRQKLKFARAKKKAQSRRAESKATKSQEPDVVTGLKQGTTIAVNKSRAFSRSAIPRIPDFYRDMWFTCKDYGAQELWTAKQQQRWYEEQGGEIEAIAVRCRSCRQKEKLRREAARKVHLDGLARKRNALA